MRLLLCFVGLCFSGLAAALVAANPQVSPAKQKNEALRSYYKESAARYQFFRDEEKRMPLTFVEKPIMTWANDDDWAGDVFAWTADERPQVLGCMITGPAQNGKRLVFNEFHLLAEEPIAPVEMLGKFRWAPREGLKLRQFETDAKPAEAAPLRLTQMRRLVGEFTAFMEANGVWELRLLPQPLMRYQPKSGPVVDGALFTYVWSKGTDPELVLLVECRKTAEGLAWFYSPARFSNRELWLKRHDPEVWRGPSHQEPQGETNLIYTTRYVETIDDPVAN